MSAEQNLEIANELVDGLKKGSDSQDVAAPFADDLSFEIQGDDGALPWIGRKVGRSAMIDFVREIRELTAPLAFDIEDVLANDKRAVIVGSLQTRIKKTGKIFATQFVIILTIDNGSVSRFQMLEDSFAISKAAR